MIGLPSGMDDAAKDFKFRGFIQFAKSSQLLMPEIFIRRAFQHRSDLCT